ncbi:MAG: TolC family protein [Bacteroidales bacterium]|nr:TolC family protein [Bacteroidales bacterium]
MKVVFFPDTFAINKKCSIMILQKRSVFVIITIVFVIAGYTAKAQTTPWTLERCIEYARQNNIQIKSQKITKELSDFDLEQTRAQRFPTLNFSSNFGVSFQNTTTYNDFMEKTEATAYSDNYGLNTGVTLYSGGKLNKTIKQKQIENSAYSYDIEQSALDIEISVIQAYLQILYANESLEIAEKAVALSQTQVERGQEMYKAGSISKADLAQMQSQNASDKHQVTQAKNSLSSAKLSLKQLLELELEENFDVVFTEFDDQQVLKIIPDLSSVYQSALNNLPQMKSSALSVESANTAISVAKTSRLPTLSASASINTGTISSAGTSYFEQLGSKINENIGLSLSIPIFNNKQIRTNINKAELQSQSAQLQDMSLKKQLLSTVESLHNDAVSAQSQYVSAKEQLDAAEASFELVNEQFLAGFKNTIELITEQNNYTNALSTLLQSRYQAVLSLMLLDLYQYQNVNY